MASEDFYNKSVTDIFIFYFAQLSVQLFHIHLNLELF